MLAAVALIIAKATRGAWGEAIGPCCLVQGKWWQNTNHRGQVCQYTSLRHIDGTVKRASAQDDSLCGESKSL